MVGTAAVVAVSSGSPSVAPSAHDPRASASTAASTTTHDRDGSSSTTEAACTTLNHIPRAFRTGTASTLSSSSLRGVSLEVIGAGFGRTGTLSMKGALESLGFGPCYHMLELFGHLEDADAWATAVRGGPFDPEVLLAGYRSTVDFPGCLIWRRLHEQHPDAKVLLTLRPAEDWWRSFSATIGPTTRDFVPADESQEGVRRLFDAIGETVFGLADMDRERCIEVYERHNAAVRSGIPADQLLVYEVGSGWEPLCEFLGVPVPEEPYPHTNTSEQFLGLADG